MAILKSGDTWVDDFTTTDPTTLEAADATAISGTLVINGVDNGAVVTVTNKATGSYKFSVTVPAGVVNRDSLALRISATVGGKTQKGVVARATGITNQLTVDANGRAASNVEAFGGTAGTFAGGRPEVNTTHWGGTAVGAAVVRGNVVQANGLAVETYPGLGLFRSSCIQVESAAVMSSSFAAGAINAAAIGANAITSAKIADGAFTAAKFAAGAFDAVWTAAVRTLTALNPVTLAAAQPNYAPAIAGDAMTLTPAERTATANVLEAAILNEGDATALLAAIAAKVEAFLINEGDATATIAAIAAACNAAVQAGTVGTRLDGIKTKTDLLTFTGTAVQANVTHYNGLAGTFNGQRPEVALWMDQSTNFTIQNSIGEKLGKAATGGDAVVSKLNGITTLGNWLKKMMRKDFVDATAEMEIGGGYDKATDSLEAIRDRGDAAWVTGAAGPTAADIATQVDTTLTASHGVGAWNVGGGGGGGVVTGWVDQALVDINLIKSKVTLLAVDTPPIIQSGIDEDGHVVIRRGDRIVIPISVGVIADLEEVWFTVKRNANDPDSSAFAQVTMTEGAKYVDMAAAPEPTDAVITYDGIDQVTILLQPEFTGLITPRKNLIFDVQIRTTSEGVETIQAGDADVLPDVTRST